MDELQNEQKDANEKLPKSAISSGSVVRHTLPGCSDIGSVFPSHIAGESEGEVSAMASSVFPETLPLCSPANVEVGLGNEWSPSSPLSSLQVVTSTI